MRGTWAGTTWVGLVLLGFVGCYAPQPIRKPPQHPEEYTMPPTDDARFSSPIAYPKDVLNRDSIKKDTTTTPGGPPRGPGTSSRMMGAPGGF